MTMPKVLVLCDYYSPATRGGALRALVQLVNSLGNQVTFYIQTRDHDPITGEKYSVSVRDEWVGVDGVEVKYCSCVRPDPKAIQRSTSQIEPDIVYANTLFGTMTQGALLANRLGLLGGSSLVVAPNGEFSPGALEIRRYKKRIYLLAGRLTGLFRHITWHASNRLEAQHIRDALPNPLIKTLPSIPNDIIHPAELPQRKLKRRDNLRLLFLSRISKKKNLPFALSLLARCPAGTSLSIVGQVEDQEVWDQCLRLIERLPKGRSATYDGEAHPEEVARHYLSADVFLFPTLGENHGYVIEDALRYQCVPVISDQTPWNSIASNEAGLVIPLRATNEWIDSLKMFHSLSEDQLSGYRNRAKKALTDYFGADDLIADYTKFFNNLENRNGKTS